MGVLVGVIVLILAAAASRQPTVVIDLNSDAQSDETQVPGTAPGTDAQSDAQPDSREAPPAIPRQPSTLGAPAESTRDLVARLRPSVVQIGQRVGDGLTTGSGFVFGARGYVATNDHVVAHGDEAHLWLSGGRQMGAAVVARDGERDVAILEPARPIGVPALSLAASGSIAIGDEVLVLGFPLGMGGEVTVTEGIVSSLRAEQGLVQISAAVNKGNSGGPVVRRDTGQVVAIVQSKIASGEGLGFSVPIEVLRELAKTVSR